MHVSGKNFSLFIENCPLFRVSILPCVNYGYHWERGFWMKSTQWLVSKLEMKCSKRELSRSPSQRPIRRDESLVLGMSFSFSLGLRPVWKRNLHVGDLWRTSRPVCLMRSTREHSPSGFRGNNQIIACLFAFRRNNGAYLLSLYHARGWQTSRSVKYGGQESRRLCKRNSVNFVLPSFLIICDDTPRAKHWDNRCE